MPKVQAQSAKVLNIADSQESGVGNVLIFGNVSEFTEFEVRKQLAGKQYERLNIYIASYGGDVFSGLVLYDYIAGLTIPTTSYVFGTAASIATVIASAADEVIMSRQALYMIHNGMAVLFGMYEAREIEETLRMLDAYQDRIVDVYERRTGIAQDEIRAMMARTEWMSPEQALSAGFVDQVVDAVELPFADMPSTNDLFDEFGFFYTNTKEMKAQLVALGYQNSKLPEMNTPNIQQLIEEQLRQRGYGTQNNVSQEIIGQITAAVKAAMEPEGPATPAEKPKKDDRIDGIETALRELKESFEQFLTKTGEEDKEKPADEPKEGESGQTPASAPTAPLAGEGEKGEDVSELIATLSNQVNNLSRQLNGQQAQGHQSGNRATTNGASPRQRLRSGRAEARGFWR